MPEPKRYQLQLLGPLSAVKLEDHPGSTLKSPTHTLLTIPPGALVHIDGAVSRSGLVNILWNGDFFSVFHEDLEKATSPLSAPEP